MCLNFKYLENTINKFYFFFFVTMKWQKQALKMVMCGIEREYSYPLLKDKKGVFLTDART